MSPRSVERAPLRPSVLDRLLCEATAPSPALRSTGVAELRRAVARDLEWLLNTRTSEREAWRALPEASTSVLAYGAPDLSWVSWASDDDRNALAQRLEQAIRRFEPRLGRVRVELLRVPEPGELRLRYRIFAVLQVAPIREPVVYDTDLDVQRGSLRVREAG